MQFKKIDPKRLFFIGGAILGLIGMKIFSPDLILETLCFLIVLASGLAYYYVERNQIKTDIQEIKTEIQKLS